ncbi:hypothetical protein [Novosphingobium sp.]|uniref:hypothetical protein n=1 Tax=Novosphingobium sp. TaxID=1874826 RepID=UPI0025D227AD|nr:hypothetical protein [Novosphingobium sp.]
MADLRTAHIEARLKRYAEEQGDPVAAVMAAFYARYPDAQANFCHHSPGNPAKLEAEMVGNTLYYMMTCFESPVETRIYFDTSVPQHRVALDVPPDWYRGFIEATIEVVEAATPASSRDEGAAWSDMRGALVGLVERNRFV